MCKYRGLTNEMICDRIVVGIQDDSVAECVQIDPELTLDKAISIARLGEILNQQLEFSNMKLYLSKTSMPRNYLILRGVLIQFQDYLGKGM